MAAKYHFISGLPRSGSTLLSAILRQNPRFFARVTAPTYAMIGAQIEVMGAQNRHASFFDDQIRCNVLRAVFDGYYQNISENLDVVFDTCRLWTSRADLLDMLFPESRIICCVRDVCWILDSFENIHRKNPTQISSLYNFKHEPSIYGRIATMMDANNGPVGMAHAALRQLWFSDIAKKMIVVRYESIVQRPKETISRLYAILNEPPFEHDFNHVSYDEPEYDHRIGLPGLHTVRGKIEYNKRESFLPPDIFKQYSNSNFWDIAAANVRNVDVL